MGSRSRPRLSLRSSPRGSVLCASEMICSAQSMRSRAELRYFTPVPWLAGRKQKHSTSRLTFRANNLPLLFPRAWRSVYLAVGSRVPCPAPLESPTVAAPGCLREPVVVVGERLHGVSDDGRWRPVDVGVRASLNCKKRYVSVVPILSPALLCH